MLCLFLDDDNTRHAALNEDGHCVWHARTAREAIELLDRIRFDFASLDHDLGGKTFVNSDEPDTGYRVALHIAGMERPPLRVRVHSYNPAGAGRMMAALAGKVRAYYAPFNGRLK